ncbi:MAG TPA: class I SAM-dependent methyltransferase [Oleiagrimonas sp.]|nr:class I SAM-dependent methyltransferase [Oleiagrimonas sp.]
MSHPSSQDAFDPRAAAYVTSPVHAQGPDLDRLEAIVRQRKPKRVIDLGCGSGHAALRIAAAGAEAVTAVDVSPRMLETVAEQASAQGLDNIATRQTDVAALPFDDASFDLLVTRFSAHHWHDFAGGLREARRVLRDDGMAVFIDVIAAEDTQVDTYLQTIETLRDPSHVRDYRLSEWMLALGEAGFAPCALSRRPLHMQFERWVARTHTPDAHVQAIRSLQQGMEPALARAFDLREDGSFGFEAVTIEAAPAQQMVVPD